MTVTLSYSGNFLTREIISWPTMSNNIAISLSFLDRSSSLLPPPFPPPSCCRIAGHSIYISVLLPLWQESFHDYDILREENQSGSACSTYLSSHLTSFIPPFISLSLSLCPFLQLAVSVRDLFLPPGPLDWSASRMQLWRQKRTRREHAAASRLHSWLHSYCAYRSILAMIGHLR